MTETSRPSVSDSAPHALIGRGLDGVHPHPPEAFKLATHQKRTDALFGRIR